MQESTTIPTVLGWMSDTIVLRVVIHDTHVNNNNTKVRPTLSRPLLQALLQGFQRKQTTTLPYTPDLPNIVIVLVDKTTDQHQHQQHRRDMLRHHILAQCDMIQPRHVNAFEIWWEDSSSNPHNNNPPAGNVDATIRRILQQEEFIHDHAVDNGDDNSTSSSNRRRSTILSGVQNVPMEGFPLWMQYMHAHVLREIAATSTLPATPSPLLFDASWTTRSILLDDHPSKQQSNSIAQQQHDDDDDNNIVGQDQEEFYQDMLQWVHNEMESLETRLDQRLLMDGTTATLSSATTDESSTASFDFGTLANDFLDAFFIRQKQLSSPAMRQQAQIHVGDQLRPLYQTYLQFLRNAYGKIYEALLDQQHVATNNEQERKKAEQNLNKAITEISERFRQDAVQATPTLAQPGGVFRDMDLEYATVLQQLLQDFQSSTELWMFGQSTDAIVDGQDDEDDDDDTTIGRFQQRIPKWVKKVGSRVLVLAVNYFQGWLAWQGIQRAALERERNFPKFPIF